MFSIYIDYPNEADEETIAKVTTTRRKVELKKVLECRRNPRIAAGGARSADFRPCREICDAARAVHAPVRCARAGFHQEMDSLRRRSARHAVSGHRGKSARGDRGAAACELATMCARRRARCCGTGCSPISPPIPKGWTPTRSCRSLSGRLPSRMRRIIRADYLIR